MKSEQLIKNILLKDESATLEFLSVANKETIARTVCGFLNSDGGQVIIGVNQDKSVSGIKDSDAAASSLSSFLVNNIVPAAPIMVSTEAFEDREVILIQVYSGSRQPYIFSGSIYFRRDSRTVKASSEEISALIHGRQVSETHWERQLSPYAELEDLDIAEINGAIREANQNGRGAFIEEGEIDKFLISQNLSENGQLTNAAVLLFGKRPVKFLPQASVRVTVFKSTKTSDEYLYDKVFDDNIFENIRKITSFFDVNISTHSKFNKDQWTRMDTTFPRFALREALLNAIIHRDYSSLASSCLVAFYPDRMEISNYGKLPEELKIADLKTNHLSLPRNPDIAQLCFITGWIEKIGRGTLKILEDCNDKGLVVPIWKSEAGATTITFPGITVTRHSNNDGDSEGDNEGVSQLLNEDLAKGESDGVVDGVTNGVRLELIKVLDLIASKPGINATEINSKINKSIASTERYISILRQLGTIERKGVSRTSGYYISKQSQKKLNKIKGRK
ncbi:ATP-dependent DNA helicase RecG [Mucilaginibacter rubeus]|uniref:RNA-binding domain-containing protein n=1 Tax=Mucilaginibacter rubeus TaxID=2027860 RepID=UPI003399553F